MYTSNVERLKREREIHKATRGPDYSTDVDLYRRRMEAYSKWRAAQAERRELPNAAIRDGREFEL